MDGKKNEEKIKFEEVKKEQERIQAEQRRKELEKKREESIEEREKEANKHKITVSGKKWVKLSKANTFSTENLKNEFNNKAREICSLTGNFEILAQQTEILEVDDTPAFGLEPKVNIGLVGIVECK